MTKQRLLIYAGVLLIVIAIGGYLLFFKQEQSLVSQVSSGEPILPDNVVAKLPQDLPPSLQAKLEQQPDLRNLSGEDLGELEAYFESSGMFNQEFEDSDGDGYSDEVERMIGLNPRKPNSEEDFRKIFKTGD